MAARIETVVLIRHACSTANRDPTVYQQTADHLIPLVAPDDDRDAAMAGDALAALGLDAGACCAWISTHLRCAQTEALVTRRAFGPASARLERRESYLLREQDYGDWDALSDAAIAARDPQRWERKQSLRDAFARFNFRFPNGESRADVAQRMVLFIGAMHRAERAHHLVFLHGVVQRAFRLAWFDRPVSWFDAEPNPGNASALVIARAPQGGWTERYLTAAAPSR